MFAQVFGKYFLWGLVVKEVFAWHVLVDCVAFGLEDFPVFFLVGLGVVALGAGGGFCLVVKCEFVVFIFTFGTPVIVVCPQVVGPFF
jgi:hypothetical protein